MLIMRGLGGKPWQHFENSLLASRCSHIKKILIVSQMFYPDHSSTSKVMTDLAVFLAENGYEVLALSQNRSYQNEKETFPPREEYKGIRIFRVPVPCSSKNSLAGRVILNLSFILKAKKRIREMGADILFSVSNPAFGSMFFQNAAKKNGMQSVYILHDLYPDILNRLGMIAEGNPFYKVMKKITERTFYEADRIVVLGEDVKNYILSRYKIGASKVRFIPNWGPSGKMQETGNRRKPAKSERTLQVLYTGNIGATADLFTLAEAASIVGKKKPEIRFRIIGGGRYYESLKNKVLELGLDNMTVETYLPEKEFLEALQEADVCFLSLKDGLTGISVPSKTYYYLSRGKPVVCQVPDDSEIAREAREWGFGIVAPADAEGLAEVFLNLCDKPEILDEMAQKAELAFQKSFSREKILVKYKSLLEELYR